MKKVLVDLLAEESDLMLMEVSLEEAGSGGDYSRRVQHLWAGKSNFYFYVTAVRDTVYEFRGEALEVVGNHVNIEARHVVDTIGSEDAAYRIALMLNSHEPVLVWSEMFRALDPLRAVAMAVADSRLVQHLSCHAAALYREEHSDLFEAGVLL